VETAQKPNPNLLGKKGYVVVVVVVCTEAQPSREALRDFILRYLVISISSLFPLHTHSPYLLGLGERISDLERK